MAHPRKQDRSSKRREEIYGKITADERIFITECDQSHPTVTERCNTGEQKSDPWTENQGGQGHSL